MSGKAYRIAVFDMDGTLYDQRRMRLVMARRLITRGAGDVPVVMAFRRLRESWKGKGGDLFAAQVASLSERFGRPEAEIRAAVTRWIYREPLEVLPRCADQGAIGLLRTLQQLGTRVAIWSDYPAADKAAALGLGDVPCFDAEDGAIQALKPDPKGLRVILERFGAAPVEALMVGDRKEKDGLAAGAVGVDVLILSHRRMRRSRQIAAFLEGQRAGLRLAGGDPEEET